MTTLVSAGRPARAGAAVPGSVLGVSQLGRPLTCGNARLGTSPGRRSVLGSVPELLAGTPSAESQLLEVARKPLTCGNDTRRHVETVLRAQLRGRRRPWKSGYRDVNAPGRCSPAGTGALDRRHTGRTCPCSRPTSTRKPRETP